MNKFQLDLTGLKLVYNLEDVNDTFFEDKLKELGVEENISEIRAGRGGQLAILDTNSKYKDVVTWDKMFDPIYAEEQVNPILPGGWRLSSYIFYIVNNGELIKLVPRK